MIKVIVAGLHKLNDCDSYVCIYRKSLKPQDYQMIIGENVLGKRFVQNRLSHCYSVYW